MAAAPVASPFPTLPSPSPTLSTSPRRLHGRAVPPPAAAASPREQQQQQQSARGAAGAGESRRRREEEQAEAAAEEFERQRKEEVNRKIASRKALSIILRREATKAVLDKREPGKGTRRLLPRTVLEALHDRVAALRWESALKVFELMRDQVWYRPYVGIYIKLITMLGKCKQPGKAHELFQAMVDEGCAPNLESYTALVSAYSRSGSFDRAFSLLDQMKATPGCRPDVQTYSILIKSCLHAYDFDRVKDLLEDMARAGIRPNTVTYNTLIDAHGKAGRFAEMESTLLEMLSEDCKPDVWTMNSTLRAFGSSGQIETMESCYEKFQASGISPNIKTYNILLDSYGKAKMYEKMGAVMEYMQKYYYSWTIVTYNVVIDAFGRAGDLEQMEYIFRLMKSDRIKPNCVTLCSLIRAYGRADQVKKIETVLRVVENSDITLDIVFFNCLVDAYGRVGRLAEMWDVLNMMKEEQIRPDKQANARPLAVNNLIRFSVSAIVVLESAKRKGRRHAVDARDEAAAQQEFTNARVAAAMREALYMLGVNPRQHSVLQAAVAAASTGSSAFPRMVLPDSPRASTCNPVPGFHVYPQASRLSGECSPDVSVVAPSTPAPAPIDLNATPVVGGSSSGGTRKRARQTPAGGLPDARNLFEEMPSAVDEDYMQNLIFEGEDYGLEEEDECDIEVEPLFEDELANQTAGPKPKRKSKRTKAYTAAEDKLLCECWRDIGQDPKTGAEQKHSTFWTRVHREFHERKKFPPYQFVSTRGWVSISKRWRVIQQECNKFCATLESVKARPVSGIGVQDMAFQALEAFKVQHNGKCFNLSHCYRVIKDEEKFKAQYAALKARGGKDAVEDVGEGEPARPRGKTNSKKEDKRDAATNALIASVDGMMNKNDSREEERRRFKAEQMDAFMEIQRRRLDLDAEKQAKMFELEAEKQAKMLEIEAANAKTKAKEVALASMMTGVEIMKVDLNALSPRKRSWFKKMQADMLKFDDE
ncbi:hypothetical protein CFC21_107714 [Triticum aestivum]|uniref:No apical meristem-associated C-terminal domain-containing protein n=1 Tax=Triticum aestivum TaxID=4565 RepID=A0A9R1MGJ6_WHEAT|nr:hypothetical protein CFC21_107714 [Triticum aestivum]